MNDEVEFFIIETDFKQMNTNDYYGENFSIETISKNSEPFVMSRKELSELMADVDFLNKRNNSTKIYIAIYKAEELTPSSIMLKAKAIKKEIEKENESRLKAENERRKKSLEKSRERKRKQLEKLKAELGDS